MYVYVFEHQRLHCVSQVRKIISSYVIFFLDIDNHRYGKTDQIECGTVDA